MDYINHKNPLYSDRRRSSYNAVHHWLRFTYGSASLCEVCGRKQRTYDYALIHGRKYLKKRENFLELCKGCHLIYDGVSERVAAMKYKSVIAVKNGRVLHFPSLNSAAAKLHILKTSINNALKGRSKVAGGYRWQYA